MPHSAGERPDYLRAVVGAFGEHMAANWKPCTTGLRLSVGPIMLQLV